MKTIDEMIKCDDQAICENIEDLEFKSRDKVSQNMLSFFRNLVEHIVIKIYIERNPKQRIERSTTNTAIEYLKVSGEYYFIRQFHGFLQDSRSHYTPENDGAERLVLKYYEYLLQIKNFMKRTYDQNILYNLEKFPLDIDQTLQEYYNKIAEKLEKIKYVNDYEKTNDRFYVQNSKAFFVNSIVYYESTLIPANDENSKFNRVVVFSKNKIFSKYAIKIGSYLDTIDIEGKPMPINILVEWSTSIRPCELKNYAKLFNMNIEVRSNLAEYIGLMNYLTKTGLNLVDVLDSSDTFYIKFKKQILYNSKTVLICHVFDKARSWIRKNKLGSNTVRYLLYGLNNKVIRMQLSDKENYKIKGLYTNCKMLPFEEIPFNSALVGHNPSFEDLVKCIGTKGHEDELLAHKIKVNANTYGKLYTKIDEIQEFGNVENLISIYNSKIYRTHQHRRLETVGKNIFIKGYEEDTRNIINRMIQLTEEHVENYSAYVEKWLENNQQVIDCYEKKEILKNMFVQSKIAMVYGAAGTGKSTLINYISNLWNESDKLYIANTNPAVENLRRKVNAGNTEFMTIKKYLNRRRKVDILFVDECSMVNNKDMANILENNQFELIVLVGDIYQIEAIQFGNWFDLARLFVPKRAQFELTKPYRTENKDLLELWKKVRNYKDDIAECLNASGCSARLNKSIFEKQSDDEIVLCLNYAGLYGINNINRFLQNANPNKAVRIGVWLYKVGDPVLFNESSKYENILYNNLKGKILDFEEVDNKVYFLIEIDRVLNGIQVAGTEIQLMKSKSSGKSIVKFPIKRVGKENEDDEEDIDTIVPFQIAYAISIHKAQGLEYESVKIVVTKEVDELISHNIFYTAITRAKKRLKIYWTPESQQKILSSFRDDKTLNDAKIFAARTKLKIRR